MLQEPGSQHKLMNHMDEDENKCLTRRGQIQHSSVQQLPHGNAGPGFPVLLIYQEI